MEVGAHLRQPRDAPTVRVAGPVIRSPFSSVNLPAAACRVTTHQAISLGQRRGSFERFWMHLGVSAGGEQAGCLVGATCG
jgi:hypothetical protein